MAVKKIDKIPGFTIRKSSENIASRRALLELDLREIVTNRIIDSEITDIAVSDSYGKEMIESTIRRWCRTLFGYTLINHYALADAFAVIRIKEDNAFRYYIHFDPEVWHREINRVGQRNLDVYMNSGSYARKETIEALNNYLDNKIKQDEADDRLCSAMDKENEGQAEE
jgi:hypothetical protein